VPVSPQRTKAQPADRGPLSLPDPDRQSPGDETPDEYVAGGEPGVVVHRSLLTERKVDREKG
jgi:hypothetical protein